MFERLAEAFETARAYQRENQLRWFTLPRWVWRCITAFWHINVWCILGRIFIPKDMKYLSDLLLHASNWILISIACVFVACVLFRICKNLYLIGRYVSDPTYESE